MMMMMTISCILFFLVAILGFFLFYFAGQRDGQREFIQEALRTGCHGKNLICLLIPPDGHDNLWEWTDDTVDDPDKAIALMEERNAELQLDSETELKDGEKWSVAIYGQLCHLFDEPDKLKK